MPEQEPQGYQYKHHKQIYLDDYQGVGRDLMEINDPVTDGFMRVSDMRSDISIVQKPQQRVRDYDQVGTVRIAKFLQVPRIDVWNRDNTIQTKKEDNTWYLAIDDQEVAQHVARSGSGKGDFNERYVQAFQQQVKEGMKDILKKEKLLNGGEYDFAFFTSYWTFLTKDLLVLPLAELDILLHSTDPAQVTQGTAEVAALYAAINVAFNGFNLVMAGAKKLKEKWNLPEERGTMRLPDWEEPFVRHEVPDYLMPTVPVDRIGRGMFYLKNHGENLIKKVK